MLNATSEKYAYCTITPTQSNRVDFHALGRDKYFWVSMLNDLNSNGQIDLLKGLRENCRGLQGLGCPELIAFFLKLISK